MDAPFLSVADTGPLAATILADTLLEQTWAASAPDTWVAAPLIVVVTCALALAKGTGRGGSEPDAVDRISVPIRSSGDAQAAVRTALRELRALAAAREVVVAVDSRASAALLFTDAEGSGDDMRRRDRPLAPPEYETYFFATPGQDAAAVTFPIPQTTIPAAFRDSHPFDEVLGLGLRVGECDARLFVIDPAPGPDRAMVFANFERLLSNLVPALARLCELHAQRHRAEARERARLGRELHDGIVQELSCLDMELELIRQSANGRGSMLDRIERVQERLRAQLVNLRTLTQRARSHDVDASGLPAVLESMVARFGRDARVHADYVSDVSEVRLPPQVCGEIARIVQEALVNVRRHSGARHVVVKFSCDGSEWKLSIQDDGRGFDASRASSDPHRRIVVPPSVIHDRVRLLGGTMRLVNPEGSGARLEISARQRDPWNRTS